MKKVLSLILTALLPMVASVPVHAAYDFQSNGINYNIIDNNSVEVARNIYYSGDIVIPSSVYYDGKSYAVTGIGFNAFSDIININSVTIPNSVTYIDQYAFEDGFMTYVTIGKGVKSIGKGAFQACYNLSSITIPNSVTSIGANAFMFCKNLRTIVSERANPIEIGDEVFSDYNTPKLIVPEGAKSAYQSKAGWQKFQNIVEFPKKRTIHVATAGTLPDLIPEYEKYFIEELTLSGELNGTDIRFIRDMSGIDYVDAWWDTSDPYYDISTPGKLKTLDISNVKIIGGEVYYCQTTGTARYKCYSSEDNKITSYMFYNLQSIKLPNNVTSIGANAFWNCSALTSVTIPNRVVSIGNYAFYGCIDLASVKIPNSVTSIGYNAFYNCPDLVRIVSRNKIPPTCEKNTFSSKGYCTVWVPKGCKEAYMKSEEWKDFKEIKEIDGDIDLNNKVNKADIDALVTYIMNGSPAIYGTIADLNGDENVNVADVVKLVSILNIQDGLSMDWQANYNSQVISSLSCTLNNDGDKAIQLTKCELYFNDKLVSSSNFKVTLSTGESKKCSFDNLASYSAKTGFSVVWHYIYNGENYTYCCDLTD